MRRPPNAAVSQSALVALVVLASGSSGRADVLLPAWEVAVDAAVSLHLAVAVLGIEAVIARRLLGLSALRTIAVVLLSNAASASAGLPLATLMFWRGLRSIWHPRGDPALVAMLLLCLPCCLLSIWIEAHVARRLVPPGKRGLCHRWAVEANAVSYIAITSVLTILLVMATVWRGRGLIT